MIMKKCHEKDKEWSPKYWYDYLGVIFCLWLIIFAGWGMWILWENQHRVASIRIWHQYECRQPQRVIHETKYVVQPVYYPIEVPAKQPIVVNFDFDFKFDTVWPEVIFDFRVNKLEIPKPCPKSEPKPDIKPDPKPLPKPCAKVKL